MTDLIVCTLIALATHHVITYDKCSFRSDTRVCPPTGPPGTVVSAVASRNTGSVPATSAMCGRSLQIRMKVQIRIRTDRTFGFYSLIHLPCLQWLHEL